MGHVSAGKEGHPRPACRTQAGATGTYPRAAGWDPTLPDPAAVTVKAMVLKIAVAKVAPSDLSRAEVLALFNALDARQQLQENDKPRDRK